MEIRITTRNLSLTTSVSLQIEKPPSMPIHSRTIRYTSNVVLVSRNPPRRTLLELWVTKSSQLFTFRPEPFGHIRVIGQPTTFGFLTVLIISPGLTLNA